jgi:hypothetical protein
LAGATGNARPRHHQAPADHSLFTALTTTQFFVQLTKNVSLNQNLYTGVMDPVTRSIRIDRSPPTCVATRSTAPCGPEGRPAPTSCRASFPGHSS